MSSFGGILATALAGGTAAIGRQAGDDIEAQRRADMMRWQADIDMQFKQRLAEFGERQRRSGALWDTTGEGGAAKLDLARRTAEQASDIAIKGKVAEATNPELLAAEDVRADAELARKIKAGKALLPLEIERASRLAAADAGTRARYREKAPTMADKAAELEAFLGRRLLPEERERMSGLTKGNPELDTVTIEEISGDTTGPHTKTTRKEVRRPGQGGGIDAVDPYAVPRRGAKLTEQQAQAEAQAAIKRGALRDAVNARLAQAGFKPLGEFGATAATDKPQGRGMLQSLHIDTSPGGRAELEMVRARSDLERFGSRQRQQDPSGFARAQQRLAAAHAAVAAIAEAEATAQGVNYGSPSFRFSKP